MTARSIHIMAVAAILTAVAGSSYAGAQNSRTYAFSCAGQICADPPTCSQFAIVGEVSTLQINSPTSEIGSVTINGGNGSIVLPSSSVPFTASITNGTASADSSGGNGIPKGCFDETITFAGALAGSATDLFGCYSANGHQIDLTPTDGGSGTCHATQM